MSELKTRAGRSAVLVIGVVRFYDRRERTLDEIDRIGSRR